MDIKSLIANYKTIAPKHCDNCGNAYGENDYHVMRNANGQMVVHLKCSKCHNSYMLNIFSPMQGVVGSTKSGINLDLNTTEEISKFTEFDAIDINEALEAYTILCKSDVLSRYLPEKSLATPKLDISN